jgi:hypothetical protein
MKSAFQKSIVNDASMRIPAPAMKLFFDDTEFDTQLQRTAAKTACRAADLGQILAVARRITPGDAQWFAEGRTEAELARTDRPGPAYVVLLDFSKSPALNGGERTNAAWLAQAQTPASVLGSNDRIACLPAASGFCRPRNVHAPHPVRRKMVVGVSA